MKTSIKTIGLLAALALGLTSPLFAQVPDLTKETQSVDRQLTYNLGAPARGHPVMASCDSPQICWIFPPN